LFSIRSWPGYTHGYTTRDFLLFRGINPQEKSFEQANRPSQDQDSPSNGDRPFVDPVSASKDKLKPLYAIVGGNPEHHPEEVYVLRSRRGDKRVWESVGSNPQLALIAKLERERYVEARTAGLAVFDDIPVAIGLERSDRQLRSRAVVVRQIWSRV
jgi:hypothetical protein